MARIPVGNFGQAVPQAHQTQLPQNQSGQIIGNVLQSAGQQAGQYLEAKDKLQRESEVAAKRLELYNNELDKKEGQLKVDAVLTTKFSDKTTELRNQVGNGTLSAAAANTALKTWSDEKFTELRTQLPGHAMPDYQNYWDANVNKQSGSFLPLQLKATEQKDRVLNETALIATSRMSRDEGRTRLNEYLATSAVSEAEKHQIRLSFEIAQDRKEVDSGVRLAVEAKDIAALRQIQASIPDKKFLDSKAAESYSMSIYREIARLENNIQIEENKRINKAGQVFNEFKSQVLTGVALGAELIQNTGMAVKGTEHEAEYNFYIKQSKDFQKFASLSTSAQLKRINEAKAYQKKHPSNDPESDNKILATYENIYNEKLKTAKENPTQALRQAGINVPDLNPTMISANPAAAAKTIAEIGAYQVAQQDKDPNATISPIAPDILPAAKKAFDNSGVNEKLAFIGNMVEATKNTKGGQQVWKETLKQLGGDDQSYVMAGVAKMHGFKSDKGQDVATAIIAGNQALKNEALIMPSKDLLKQKFNAFVGGSATGETGTMTFDAYRSIYAYLSQRDNRIHKDSKDIDKNISELALGLATGGVYTQNTSYGSTWKVSKPYGMSDSRFKASLEKGYAEVAHITGHTVAELKNWRLSRSDKKTSKGELLYDLINERGNPLLGPNGGVQRIVFTGVTK
ncbi:hypothetical protein [Acinetobacter rudis]|uniref:Methyl-coenzyme M reductase n=1 Tax=Acinetobacter rudis CIP 110305 TaxID=421052 RepID=S3N0Y8_9GAMM|nr:hypothetical protein [Acinetobacter rudis]EPF73785.1 hypothetical protein F945_01944 [Acinetobacter rudis CIP 110305]